MRVEDLTLEELGRLAAQTSAALKIAKILPHARFDLSVPGRVGVVLSDETCRPGPVPVPAEKLGGDGGGLQRLVPAENDHLQAGSGVSPLPAEAQPGLEPVAPAGEAVPQVPPAAAAVPAGAGEQTAPAVPEGVAPADDAPVRESGTGKPEDELGRHLWHLPRKGGWDFPADHQLMELACLGWTVPNIAAEMGRDDLDVKRRFDLLVKNRTFKRGDVLARLNDFLALAEAAE